MPNSLPELWLRIFGCGLAILLCVSGAGCVALVASGAAGAAGYAYLKGSQTRTYARPLDVVENAVQASLTSMELAPTKHRADQTGSVTKTETAHGKKLVIETRPVGGGTEVKVRAGTFGDDDLTHYFFTQLESRIQAIQSVTVPADPAASAVVPAPPASLDAASPRTPTPTISTPAANP